MNKEPTFPGQGYDPNLIRDRAPAAKVIECPCCGHQGLVKVVRHLPKGYDDPNHPISMYPLSQVGMVVAEVSWASMSQTEEDDAPHHPISATRAMRGE